MADLKVLIDNFREAARLYLSQYNRCTSIFLEQVRFTETKINLPIIKK